MEQIKLENYANMARKKAHEISKAYDYDYEDLEAQAFLILVEAYKKYDSSKSRFSTHLFWNLKDLNNYCSKQTGFTPTLDIMETEIEDPSSLKYQEVLEFYDRAYKELTQKAQIILSHLLEGYVGRVPRYNSFRQYIQYLYDWSLTEIEKAWKEIKIWWLNYGENSELKTIII